MPAPSLPVSFPFQLSSTDPDGATESCRLLDDRIREIHEQIALLLNLPLDTNIAGPIAVNGSILGSIGQDSRWVDATHFRLHAEQVMTADANNQIKLHTAPADQTVNIGTAGPAANGRDQAGAFGSNVFVHFYWIYNPTTTTLAGIASLTAPASGGPALPANYLLGAYAGAMQIGAVANQLVQANIRGRWTTYFARQVVLADTGATGSHLPIDFSVAIPANCTNLRVGYGIHGTVGGPTVNLTVFDGLGGDVGFITLPSEASQLAGFLIETSNFGTAWSYSVTTARATFGFNVEVSGFENANAG